MARTCRYYAGKANSDSIRCTLCNKDEAIPKEDCSQRNCAAWTKIEYCSFLVERNDHIRYDEDSEMVVVAKDEKDALKQARKNSADFKFSKDLTVTKIDLSKRRVILKINMNG